MEFLCFKTVYYLKNVIITYSLCIKFLTSWDVSETLFCPGKSLQYKMGPRNSAFRHYTYCLNALSIEIRDILDILITSETLGGSFTPFRDCWISPFFFEDEFPISVYKNVLNIKVLPQCSEWIKIFWGLRIKVYWLL